MSETRRLHHPATYRSERRFVVLHVLRLKGLAEPALIAEAANLTVDHVAQELTVCMKRNLVERSHGAASGWRPTIQGRKVHAELLLAERAAIDLQGLSTLYDSFLGQNETFKSLCLDWLDGHERAECLNRLSRIYRSLVPILDQLSLLLERMSSYKPRFASALDRVHDGDNDAFAMPLTRSFHDVWMELHTDLLETLGRSRAARDGA